jgi:hypothetical protein
LVVRSYRVVAIGEEVRRVGIVHLGLDGTDLTLAYRFGVVLGPLDLNPWAWNSSDFIKSRASISDRRNTIAYRFMRWRV